MNRECALVPDKLTQFETTLNAVRAKFDTLRTDAKSHTQDNGTPLLDFAQAWAEFQEAEKLYEGDRTLLVQEIANHRKKFCATLPTNNKEQHAARAAFDPIDERLKGLSKQINLLYKLATRVADTANELANASVPPFEKGNYPAVDTPSLFGVREPRSRFAWAKPCFTHTPHPSMAWGDDSASMGWCQVCHNPLEKGGEREARGDFVASEGKGENAYDRRGTTQLLKQLDEARIVWLHERFPDATLQAVPGLVKLVDRKEIAAADWSLTPGRYFGVAPPEEDDEFDFEETLRDIHVELASLNEEAAELAKKIQENLEGLGV